MSAADELAVEVCRMLEMSTECRHSHIIVIFSFIFCGWMPQVKIKCACLAHYIWYGYVYFLVKLLKRVLMIRITFKGPTIYLCFNNPSRKGTRYSLLNHGAISMKHCLCFYLRAVMTVQFSSDHSVYETRKSFAWLLPVILKNPKALIKFLIISIMEFLFKLLFPLHRKWWTRSSWNGKAYTLQPYLMLSLLL